MEINNTSKGLKNSNLKKNMQIHKILKGYEN